MYKLNSIFKIFLFVFFIHLINLYNFSILKAEDVDNQTSQISSTQTPSAVSASNNQSNTTASDTQDLPSQIPIITNADQSNNATINIVDKKEPQSDQTQATQIPLSTSTQNTNSPSTQSTPNNKDSSLDKENKKEKNKKNSKELRKEKTVESKRIVPYKLRSDLVLQDYTYFQFNLTFDLFSKFYKTTFSYDTQINQLNKAKQRSNFELFEMNQNYILGYFNQKLGMAFEFNFGQGTHYSKTINGQEVTNINTNAAIYSSYATFNFKQDLFYLTKNQAFIFFYKLGLGIGYNYISSEALTVPDLYMLGGFGITYRISKHFDTALGYNIASTAYSKRYTDEYSSFKQTLIESTLYVSIVYKFYMDN